MIFHNLPDFQNSLEFEFTLFCQRPLSSLNYKNSNYLSEAPAKPVNEEDEFDMANYDNGEDDEAMAQRIFGAGLGGVAYYSKPEVRTELGWRDQRGEGHWIVLGIVYVIPHLKASNFTVVPPNTDELVTDEKAAVFGN